MDTNQNTANNYQINTFTKGMNSDTSYDMIGADQYLFGQNIRITNNTLIFGDQHQNTTEGVVTPVYQGKETTIELNNEITDPNRRILATASIGDLGVIVIGGNTWWTVLRVERQYLNQADSDFNIETWYTYQQNTDLPGTFSIVLHKETDDIINLYIADGQHPIIQMNLQDRKVIAEGDENYEKNGESAVLGTNIDYLMANRILPTDKINITRSQGRLLTQQVQYTYRLYDKHGVTTKLSPLTTKLQVIDSNRHRELGNAENTRTSVGLQLSIDFSAEYSTHYDHIQIYRISYIKPNQVPDVYLIYDDKFINNSITFVDKGDEELQKLSIDEFYAMSGQIIIPQSIEQNQGYMFAGNVEDRTLIHLESEEITGNSVEVVYVDVPIRNKKAIDYSNRNLVDHTGINEETIPTISQYFAQCGIVFDNEMFSYEDMFGSSLLRSLRRDEYYRYGVVYYDKYGARSEVYRITTGEGENKTDLYVPNNDLWYEDGDTIMAKNAAAKFKIHKPSEDVIGFQIVRCAKTDEYTKNLLQVALSRPSRQGKCEQPKYRTPYYPNVYMTTQFLYITYLDHFPVIESDSVPEDYDIDKKDLWLLYPDRCGTNVENMTLYQIFSPEINIVRTDTSSKLKVFDAKLTPLYFVYEQDDSETRYDEIAQRFQTRSSIEANKVHLKPAAHYPDQPGSCIENVDSDYHLQDSVVHTYNNGAFISIKALQQDEMSSKSENNVVINAFKKQNISSSDAESITIKNIEDVKNPAWSDGFSNKQLNGSEVTTAIKKYKSYVTHIGDKNFVNWVANGLYDLPVSSSDAETQPGANGNVRVFYNRASRGTYTDNQFQRGWIGPGPVSLLIDTELPSEDSIFRKQVGFGVTNQNSNMLFGTIVANIQHEVLEYNDSYTQYYGFGNFFTFDGAQEKTCYIMDGDVYITPAEFVNMFKTYDFNDGVTTLPSGQVIYYIPMESRINTFFDYGMNYRNTSSTNLMLEPGDITGITMQARPLHQYNMIYSDNNTSIEIFSPHIDNEDTNDHYPQRIQYSQLKTNGENIDNWQIFKAADFIDVDSQYGDVTHLLTSDNTLYYWQNRAFGKLSVNERSLVKDENSNAIQLGTGGVLNRYDYLSTRYGMRQNDRAAIAAEHGIYWIDINNKAIPAFTGNGVVNYSEICNVQNLVNEKMQNHIPTIYYDLQNYEVLCGIDIAVQLVFNIKLNCATAIYTRFYDKCLDINNTLYGIVLETNILYRKLNYLTVEDEDKVFLDPISLSFAVNPQASLTKVYDTQKIVLMDNVDETNIKNFPDKIEGRDYRKINYPFLKNKTWKFTTDYQLSEASPEAYRDTENNVWYAVPRHNGKNTLYGDRMRGKWLKVDIKDEEPKPYAISHIITKFRQSYS